MHLGGKIQGSSSAKNPYSILYVSIKGYTSNNAAQRGRLRRGPIFETLCLCLFPYFLFILFLTDLALLSGLCPTVQLIQWVHVHHISVWSAPKSD